MDIEALYIHTWTQTRKVRTADGQGGWTAAPVVIDTFPGRMRPASAAEKTVALQQQAEISHVFYCSPQRDVQRGDWLTGEGITVEVIAVREPSYIGHHLEVDCLAVQKEPVEEGS